MKILKPALLLIVLCILSLMFVRGCNRYKSVRDLFEQAKQREDEGDLDAAIAGFTRVIELETQIPAAYADRATAERQLKEYDDAILDYNRALEINPKDDYAYRGRGLAKYKKEDIEGAIADYNKAIELNPTNAIAYNNRGWAEFQKNDFDSSINDATHSIQLNPNDGYAYGTRGWARYGKGDVSGAIEDCKKAVEFLKPDSAPSFHDQGLLDFIAGDYKKAVADWQKAIQQDINLKRELQPWIDKAQVKLQEKKL